MTVVSDYRSLLSNTSWEGAATGAGIILTYSFSTAATASLQATNPTAAASFTPLNASEQATVQAALAQWSAVSGITFQQTTTVPGDIVFGFYNLASITGGAGEAGLGNYPSTGTYVDGNGVPQIYSNFLSQGGDVYFDTSYQTNPAYFADFAHVAIHEIGHALGLKHPFDDATAGPDYTLTPALDTGSETVMAYAGLRSPTLEPLDIGAVQYLYGTSATATHPFTETWNAATQGLTVTGSATVAQQLFGSAGNDVFYSLGPHDAIAGGGGNDLFYLDGRPAGVNGGDGSGTETVVTGLTYASLGAAPVQAESGAANVHYIYLPAYADFQTYTNATYLEFTDGTYAVATGVFTSWDALASPGTTNADTYLWAAGASGSWGRTTNWTDQSYAATLLPPGANDVVVLTGAGSAAAPATLSGRGNAAGVSLATGYASLSGTFGFGTLGVGGVGSAGLSVAGGAAVAVGGAASVSQASGAPAPALRVLAGGRFQAGSLVVQGAGGVQFTVDGSGGPTIGVAGTLEVGTAGTAAAGTLAVDAGASMSGCGNVAGSVVDNGQVVASGGTLAFSAQVAGTGTMRVAAGARLVLAGAVNQAVGFAGATGTLDLVNPVAGVDAGVVSGFGVGTTIEVVTPAAGAITGASYSSTGSGSGRLALLRGATTVATLQLAGSYTAAQFQVAAQAGGVADITLAPPVVADPLFDAAYYLAHNPDVAAAGVDPYQHYLVSGWREGRDPSGLFDGNYYLAQNPDVKAAGVDPLLHFEQSGWREGRDPSLLFSDSKYLAANPDVAAAGLDPLLHYMVYGQHEGRAAFLTGSTQAADVLVNAAYYDAQLGATLVPGGAAGAQQAAASFNATGWLKGLNPDAFFDTSYYLAHNPDVAAAHVDPLTHYETYGWREGRDASAVFSTGKYLAAYGDVRAAGLDPLVHYLTFGQGEGRVAFAV